MNDTSCKLYVHSLTDWFYIQWVNVYMTVVWDARLQRSYIPPLPASRLINPVIFLKLLIFVFISIGFWGRKTPNPDCSRLIYWLSPCTTELKRYKPIFGIISFWSFIYNCTGVMPQHYCKIEVVAPPPPGSSYYEQIYIGKHLFSTCFWNYFNILVCYEGYEGGLGFWS